MSGVVAMTLLQDSSIATNASIAPFSGILYVCAFEIETIDSKQKIRALTRNGEPKKAVKKFLYNIIMKDG